MPYKPKITTRGISVSTVSTDNTPKNAALINDELDSNFLNLRNASIGIAGDDSGTIDLGMGNTLKVVGTGGLTTAAAGQTLTIDGSGIAPSSTTGNLTFAKSIGLTANSGGSDTIATGDSGHDAYFKTSGDGSYNFINTTSTVGIMIADSGLAAGGSASGLLTAIGITGGGNRDLNIRALGTGKVAISGIKYPSSDGTNGQVLTTNGSGVLSFTTAGSASTGTITFNGNDIASSADANITITSQENRNIVLTAGATGNGDVFLQAGPQGAVGIRGPVEIAFDTSDAVGSGNAMHIGELYLRINKGGNDLQNVFIQQNGATSIGSAGANALFHAELYRDVVTIGDFNIALNNNNRQQGQGTAKFNVFGSTHLDNVEIDDNKITTYNSNEDLVLDANGTGIIQVNTSILPEVTDTLDLGSAAKRFKDLYLTGGTINLGDATISASGSAVILPTGSTIDGNLTITGNLSVEGTEVILNTETLEVQDNKILLNSNVSGAPSIDAGIEVKRGNSANKSLLWNETTDKWTIGSETFVAGTVEANVAFTNITGLPTTVAGYGITDAISGANLLRFVGDDSTGTTLNSGETIKIVGAGGLTAVVTADTITLDGTDIQGSGNAINIDGGDAATIFTAANIIIDGGDST